MDIFKEGSQHVLTSVFRLCIPPLVVEKKNRPNFGSEIRVQGHVYRGSYVANLTDLIGTSN